MHQLLAQTSDSLGLPTGKAVAMIVFFGAMTVISLIGLFSSRQMLESMAGLIGTKNPIVARVVCGVTGLIGAFVVIAASLSLMGKL